MSSRLRGLVRLLWAESSGTGLPWQRRAIPSLGGLEDRTLLDWSPLGPMPQFNNQATIQRAGGNDVPGNISGRVLSLAYTFPRAGGVSAALLLGSAGGAIYRTQSLVAGSTTEFSLNPTWQLVSPGAGDIRDVTATRCHPRRPRASTGSAAWRRPVSWAGQGGEASRGSFTPHALDTCEGRGHRHEEPCAAL